MRVLIVGTVYTQIWMRPSILVPHKPIDLFLNLKKANIIIYNNRIIRGTVVA